MNKTIIYTADGHLEFSGIGRLTVQEDATQAELVQLQVLLVGVSILAASKGWQCVEPMWDRVNETPSLRRHFVPVEPAV